MFRKAVFVVLSAPWGCSFVLQQPQTRRVTPQAVEESAAPASVADVPLTDSNYVAMGLAKVFFMSEGKAQGQYIIEPLTAGTLETLQLGVPTSYCRIFGTTCGDLFDDPANPSVVQVKNLAKLTEGYENVQLCESMIERSMAAARTFRRRPEAAEYVAVDDTSEEVNFNTDRKRIMDLQYEPSFDDNVKQDRSIDVYNRGGGDDDTLADEINRLAES
ncbi:hypothetical protein CTAYLR_001759 [Chrysophaeum taylorii]|uniref:Uncharacterized protein n=1 Tax=Chrysophaeum taylorii TaxID=2483200 RepID=A0AAD7UEW4_9STRA|nr:hypothetical protein CTAYLR_001759 [Chrysophaeum taylorii]